MLILSAIALGIVAWRLPAASPQDSLTFVPATFACDAESCRQTGAPSGSLAPSPSPPGRGEPDSDGVFSSGEIDLTGDGIRERVELTEGMITVFQDGAVIWQSPPTWDVVDLALGDPNDDGRFEILAAFWRDDVEGVPRSQPFIIGYREGGIRTLWGGSPIAEPIVELELGDVTGDGMQDLIVLEAPSSAPSPRWGQSPRPWGEAGREEPAAVSTTVAVWRWHGWGFSRMWRSEEGRYRDLILLPGTDGDPATFAVHVGIAD